MPRRIKDNGTSTTSPCCKAPVLWETIGLMRLLRERQGRIVYDVRCSKCNMQHEVDSGRARA